MSRLLDEAVWDHKPAGLIALAPGQKSPPTSLDVLSVCLLYILPTTLNKALAIGSACGTAQLNPLQLRPTATETYHPSIAV